MIKDMSELIIIDTEYTTWEGAQDTNWGEDWQYRELVQIAAIKVHLPTYEEIDKLDILIRPIKNPKLSDFFIELTSITQEQLDKEGIDLSKGLEDLAAFCEGFSGNQIVTYGADEGIIEENCNLQVIDNPLPSSWRNIRPYLQANGVDVDTYSSGRLHELTNHPIEGHVHYALHDVRSIARYLKFQQSNSDGDIVSKLPHYKSA